MAVNINTAARNAATNSILSLLSQGTTYTNSYIEIRTGRPPNNPLLPATGTLLSRLELSNEIVSPSVNGSAVFNPINPDVDVDENGIAGWFRIYNRNGQGVIDGTITPIGGGGDIEIDNVNFVKGGIVRMEQLIGTTPA